MTARRPRPAGAEAGFVTVEFVLGVVLLVIPVALVVLTLPAWFSRQELAREAAQQAARAAVVNQSTAPAQAVVTQIAADNGLGAGQMGLAFSSSPTFSPGGVVTAEVSVQMPAVHVFGVGSFGSFTWTASFSEPVDQYRSLP